MIVLEHWKGHGKFYLITIDTDTRRVLMNGQDIETMFDRNQLKDLKEYEEKKRTLSFNDFLEFLHHDFKEELKLIRVK